MLVKDVFIVFAILSDDLFITLYIKAKLPLLTGISYQPADSAIGEKGAQSFSLSLSLSISPLLFLSYHRLRSTH